MPRYAVLLRPVSRDCAGLISRKFNRLSGRLHLRDTCRVAGHVSRKGVGVLDVETSRPSSLEAFLRGASRGMDSVAAALGPRSDTDISDEDPCFYEEVEAVLIAQQVPAGEADPSQGSVSELALDESVSSRDVEAAAQEIEQAAPYFSLSKN